MTQSYAFNADPDMQLELKHLKEQAAMAAPVEHQILQATGLKTGMQALDVGCGPGFVSIEMAKIVGPQGHLLGVDISEKLLETARTYAQEQGFLHTDFEQGSVYDLKVPPASRDYAYARFFVQNLERPLDGIRQISNTLKSGGRICIVDVDDQWLNIYPEPQGFQAFNEHAIAEHHAHGGDRYVGRKLANYLQQAGFDNPTMQIVPVTSSEIGMEAFMQIAVRQRCRFIPEAQRAEALKQYEEIYRETMSHPQSWGMLGLFVASATKA
jgi:ubiquinone/menaquinone biosynthesis C-methylase UbiE